MQLEKLSANLLSQDQIKELWQELRNISVDYDDEEEPIEQDFYHWPAGTPRETIWHWFDLAYDKGLYKLMFPNDLNHSINDQ